MLYFIKSFSVSDIIVLFFNLWNLHWCITMTIPNPIEYFFYIVWDLVFPFNLVYIANYIGWFSNAKPICVPGINPTWSWCSIQFLFHWLVCWLCLVFLHICPLVRRAYIISPSYASVQFWHQSVGSLSKWIGIWPWHSFSTLWNSSHKIDTIFPSNAW